MTRQVRLGLIGTGAWGRKLAATITTLNSVRLLSLAASRPLPEQPPADDCCYFPGWRELIDAGGLDGILIATPARLNAQIALYSVEQGFATYVEKPMSMDVATACQLYRQVQAGQGILYVGYLDLFQPGYLDLQEKIQEIAPVTAVQATFGGPGPVRDNVSALWDWGSHGVAVLIDLFGEPGELQAARIRNKPDGKGFAERFTLTFGYPGFQARLETGNDLPEKKRQLRVSGENGELFFQGQGKPSLRLTGSDGVFRPDLAAVPPLTLCLESFIGAIRRSDTDHAMAELGLAVTRVLALAEQQIQA